MDKIIRVKPHWRNQTTRIKGYTYVRKCKEPDFSKKSWLSLSRRDDLSRKVLALRQFTDYQSEVYQQMTQDVGKSCPEALAVIQGQRKFSKRSKVSKEFYEGINHAYNLLYTE